MHVSQAEVHLVIDQLEVASLAGDPNLTIARVLVPSDVGLEGVGRLGVRQPLEIGDACAELGELFLRVFPARLEVRLPGEGLAAVKLIEERAQS